MAVFRIERTRDYTVMSNHHLRNHQLSLKAKGLLSMMLSLPDDWNYTTRGLAKICKEGVDAIGGALRELESAGYIVRHQLRDRQGRISDTEYVIYEQPQPRQPETPQPDTAAPDTDSLDTDSLDTDSLDTDSLDTDSLDTAFPYLDKPDTEKPAELNIEKSNTQKSITQRARTDSIPFREPAAARPPERKGRDAISLAEMESYRDLILENIEYDYLCREFSTYREDLDEIVELIVETVCARRKTTRIAGADFPHEVVRSRFLKLDSSHIEFVMECLHNNSTEIRNMKQYLLTVLFNAPTTMSNHYTAQVNHDMHAGGW
ncbi:UNVERIFIED_CONTAM: helix-turn-helix domain-containing protein [Bacteroidetes bacterium 56_B9]